jgi:hypothetical protein
MKKNLIILVALFVVALPLVAIGIWGIHKASVNIYDKVSTHTTEVSEVSEALEVTETQIAEVKEEIAPTPAPSLTKEDKETAQQFRIKNAKFVSATRMYTYDEHPSMMWQDALLFESDNSWTIIIRKYHQGTLDAFIEDCVYPISKKEMCTPTRSFNAVMWDQAKGQPIPCVFSSTSKTWNFASRYADGSTVIEHISDSPYSPQYNVRNLDGGASIFIKTTTEKSDNGLYVKCTTACHTYTINII